VRKAKATYSDTVKVAGVVVKVRKLVKDFEINLKGNCAAEFDALKKVHDDYKAAKGSLAQNQNISQVLRISSPTIVGVGVNIATGTQQTWATILGVGLSLLLAYLGGNKFAERMNRLEEEFTEEYRCPKCGFSLRGKSWERWKDEKVCPSCKILWIEE
jgi:rubredoxin